MAVSEHAVSAVILREEKKVQYPIYYVSKTLLDAETRYSPLEKLLLALVMASRKLNHYFQAYPVEVVTEYPLKTLLGKADMSGRVAKWSVELAQYDLKFVARTAIKAQVLADFVAEFTIEQRLEKANQIWKVQVTPSHLWKLQVDGSSTRRGSGAGIVLVAPEGEVLEMAIRLGFPATNNEAEYEALFQGVQNALRLGAKELVIYSDSQLVVNQLTGLYSARTATMAAYMEKTKQLLDRLHDYKVIQIPREQNDHADALATLASADQLGVKRVIQVQVLERPSIDEMPEEIRCAEEQAPSWMDPIIAYLKDGILPEDKKEARKLAVKAARFWLSPDQKLYKKSFSGPYLLCVHPARVEDLLFEIHEGSCGAHAAGRTLAFRAITQGFWWPYMQKDALQYVKKCEKCQKFAPIPHQPAGDLCPLTSPWPFAQWGLDIIGPLLRATGNRRFLITATDYFTKWIEARALAAIRDIETRKFVWENIITRFGIPHALISDNGTQFSSRSIQQDILDGIKKRLESSKGRWVEELPSVLWAYRTTPRRSTGESPFVLAYGTEAVIPLEIGLPTLRTQVFEEGNNDLAMERNLDLLQERRDRAMVRLAAYQQVLSRSYNKNVRARSFEIGDFVLRKVLSQTKDPTDGKLGPNWEGPFQVIARVGQGAYKLVRQDGKAVHGTWNISNLRRFYVQVGTHRSSLRGGWKGGKKLLAVDKEAKLLTVKKDQKLLQNCHSTVSAVTPHVSAVIHHSSTVLSLPPINGQEKSTERWGKRKKQQFIMSSSSRSTNVPPKKRSMIENEEDDELVNPKHPAGASLQKKAKLEYQEEDEDMIILEQPINHPLTQVIEIEDDEDDEELKVLDSFLTSNVEEQVEDLKEQLQYMKREFQTADNCNKELLGALRTVQHSLIQICDMAWVAAMAQDPQRLRMSLLDLSARVKSILDRAMVVLASWSI
ncbi:uncharacterized protein LOC119987002 [Tripterygium wilfordii]|uniref:uncharacterized protein LOC119987002 n=1 Tax=Tripterygium wilfordii TaxID=458696 RepID=UPI0018F80AB4|nr:uncharacterized protein LOC119987002 [Tripterygium wilfordii]